MTDTLKEGKVMVFDTIRLSVGERDSSCCEQNACTRFQIFALFFSFLFWQSCTLVTSCQNATFTYISESDVNGFNLFGVDWRLRVERAAEACAIRGATLAQHLTDDDINFINEVFLTRDYCPKRG